MLREEPLKEEISRKKEVLDVSKKSLKAGQKQSLKDISSPKSADRVMFFYVDEEEDKKSDRIGEALRIAAVGTLILVVLNVVNIYQRGLTLKDSVVSAATSGYEELIRAGDEAASADFGAAEITFNEANAYFESAQNSIAYLRVNQEYFFTREQTLQSVQGVLDAAKNIASSGQNFSRGIQNIQQLPTLFIEENIEPSGESGRQSLTEKLKEDLTYINTAIEQLNTAQKNLELVSADVLPPTFREKLSSAKSKLETLNNVLAQVQNEIPALLNLLGDRYPHRYLVLLQNDTEARPTGGFIGSYVIIDINDGYLTKMDFHDIYELDGQLQEHIEPPSDIALVSENWRMRDANYSPDFVISAEKAAWFLQKQKGPSVDTIIAINQSFIADLLELTGPIQLGSLNAPLNKENFQVILSYIIESKISGVENPKQIMAELVPAFQKKLLQEAPMDQILVALVKGIHEKKLLFYSRNEAIQKLFDDFGMTEHTLITGEKEDYLNVVVTSVGGNKSDRYINQSIDHSTLIQPDGTVVNEVSITRKHTWTLKDLEAWRAMLKSFGFDDLPPHIQTILGSGPNKVFVKLYVPKGSKLVSTEGSSRVIQREGFPQENVLTEDADEIDKTFFMIQMETIAGREETVSVTYVLPYKLKLLPADSYKFHAQVQPAINPSFIEKKVFFKPGLQSYREYPPSFTVNDKGYVEYNGILSQDLYLSTLVGN